MAPAAAPASFAVTPKQPLDSQAITVSWRPKAQPPKGRYRLDLRTGDSYNCESAANVALTFRWRPGIKITKTLRPRAEKKYWCPGGARVRLYRTRGTKTELYEEAGVAIEDNKETENPGPFGSPATITLLAGSSMTVKVAGRPDRTSALTGELRGFIPGRFKPNADLQVTLIRGSISATSLPADPSCTPAGRTYPSPIGLYSAPPIPGAEKWTEPRLTNQSMTLLSAGRASLGLTLDKDHVAALTGCAGGSDATSYPLAFTGNVGPTGLVSLTISGGTEGLKLSDGATASVLFTLVLRAEL